MKKQILVTLFITLVGLPISQAQVAPSDVDRVLEEAFIIITYVTMKTSSPELKSVGQKILELKHLIRAYSPPPGKEFVYCQNHPRKESLTTYMREGRNDIYICQATLERIGPSQLVQSLIHEMIHIVGVDDECETYRLENAIVEAYGRGDAYDSDYKSMCQ